MKILGYRELRIGKDDKGWWNTYLNHGKNRSLKELFSEIKYAYRVDHDKMLKNREHKRARKMASECLASSGYRYQIIITHDGSSNKKKYKLKYCRHQETGRYKFTWDFDSEYEMNRFIIDKLLLKPLMFPLHKATFKKQ